MQANSTAFYQSTANTKKTKDWTHRDMDLHLVLKESLRTRTATNVKAMPFITVKDNQVLLTGVLHL